MSSEKCYIMGRLKPPYTKRKFSLSSVINLSKDKTKFKLNSSSFIYPKHNRLNIGITVVTHSNYYFIYTKPRMLHQNIYDQLLLPKDTSTIYQFPLHIQTLHNTALNGNMIYRLSIYYHMESIHSFWIQRTNIKFEIN